MDDDIVVVWGIPRPGKKTALVRSILKQLDIVEAIDLFSLFTEHNNTNEHG